MEKWRCDVTAKPGPQDPGRLSILNMTDKTQGKPFGSSHRFPLANSFFGNFPDFKHEVTLEAIPSPPDKFPRVCVTWLS